MRISMVVGLSLLYRTDWVMRTTEGLTMSIGKSDCQQAAQARRVLLSCKTGTDDAAVEMSRVLNHAD